MAPDEGPIIWPGAAAHAGLVLVLAAWAWVMRALWRKATS